MNILDMIKRVDYKTVDLTAVLTGCSNAVLESVGVARNRDMVKYRAGICEGCKLNVNGVCFRDLRSDLGETEQNLTSEQLATRVRDNDAITGELKFGCGCAIRCKITLKKEGCPLNKWLPIKK